MTTPADLSRANKGLERFAAEDLSALWAQVNTAAEAEVALKDLLPDIVQTYGQQAATIAADWYDDLRESMGVGGGFTSVPAELSDQGTDALIGWALDYGTDLASIQELIWGGTQRRIMDWSRHTVMGSSIADPRARGWQRVSVGDTCTFCLMLVSRGAVYSESTVKFGAHDNDDCVAAPAFTGRPQPVEPFRPSMRKRSEADKKRAEDWIEAHVT